MPKIESSRLAIKLSIIGIIISVLFLVSNLKTDYPLMLPISIVVANLLILIGNYIRYRKVLGGKK